MGILNLLINIRQKSLHARKAVLVASVFFLMAIVITLWIMLPDNASQQSAASAHANAETLGPIDLLLNELRTFISPND